jgi:hypothetical protein
MARATRRRQIDRLAAKHFVKLPERLILMPEQMQEAINAARGTLPRISTKVLDLTLFRSQRTNRSRANRSSANPNDQLL